MDSFLLPFAPILYILVKILLYLQLLCIHKVKVKLLSYVWVFEIPWTVAYQAPLFMEFSRQEYWSGLPFPSPGDLPNPGTEPGSPALQANSLPFEPPGKHTLLVGMKTEQCAYCSTASFLILTLYYSWIKYNLWENCLMYYLCKFLWIYINK